MIKITVDTKEGVQIVKGGTIVKGELKDLLFELTALQSTIVGAIVEQSKDKLHSTDIMEAKLGLVDTMARTTKVAIECGHEYTNDVSTTVQHITKEAAPKERTVNDVIKGGLGIDMDKITWEIYATNELIDKWWPVMNDHIMTKEEMKQLHKDAETVGINMDDLLNAMIDKYGEEQQNNN